LYEAMVAYEEALAEQSDLIGDWRAPWAAPGAEELDHMSLGERIAGIDLGEPARQLVEIMEANNNTRPVAEQSLLGTLTAVRAGGGEAYFTESEIYRCRGGNSSLVRSLAEALGAESIRLGAPVTEIRPTSSGRVVAVDRSGVEHEADHLVLATPPTTWDTIRFDGSLALPSPPTSGPAVKVLAPVDSAFWLADGWSQYGMGDGRIGMCWEGTYLQDGGPEAALIGFSGADAAEALLQVPAEDRQRVITEELEAFHPGYEEHRTRTAAMVRWPEDPWTRMGYSCPAPGTVTTALREVSEGTELVSFVGEHASPGFFGFMEGALESGARCARRLAERDGLVRAARAS
jgi:monoamine oxidase